MQTLTDLQIKRLYEFTKSHFVEWYDVQTELVDHLANGIENTWKESPHLSFENALNKEFRKFGVFGFSDLIEEKTNTLNRMYLKQVWNHFKTFFRLPKIIATLFCMWFLFLILQSLNNKLFVTVPFVILVTIIHIYFLYNEKKQIKNRNKKTGKKWLIDTVIIRLGGLIHFLNLGIWIPQLIDSNKLWTDFSILVLAIGIVLYLLLLFISIKIVSPKLKEKMHKEYSEYLFI
jgi:hypothetical protein